MTKKIVCSLLCLVLSGMALFSGCAQEEDGALREQIIGALMMDDLPAYTLQDHETKTSENGSLEFYAVIVLDEKHAYELENQTLNWQKTPVNTTYRNLTDYLYILPEAAIKRAREALTEVNGEEARWMFADRTSEFKKKYKQQIKEAAGQSAGSDSAGAEGTSPGSSGSMKLDPSGIDPRTPDYAVGFSCAFYLPSKHTLYVYEYSPAFDNSLLKYVL